MDSKTKEELLYLLSFCEDYIQDLVYNVIDDSEEDPHYSAVTANNLIKCYVDVMKYFKNEVPFSDIKSFFDYNLLDVEKYKKFEKSREIENNYYVGKIW